MDVLIEVGLNLRAGFLLERDAAATVAVRRDQVHLHLQGLHLN